MQKKILLLTGIAFFITSFCLHTKEVQAQSASTGNEESRFSYYQDEARILSNPDPLISLELKNVPLERALDRIAKQARAGLYFNSDFLPKKDISLHLNGVSLSDALRQVLEGTQLEAHASGRNIMLKKKKALPVP